MRTNRLTDLVRALRAVASDKYDVKFGFSPDRDEPTGFWMELRPEEVVLEGHRYTNLREVAGKLIDRVALY